MKFILFIFTFSGIYIADAQNPEKIIDSVQLKTSAKSNDLNVNVDSVQVINFPSIRLFPNPANNKIEIEIKGFKPGDIKIQLIDKQGKIVRDEKRLVFIGDEKITFMFLQNPGLYFLIVRQKTIIVKNRLIIQ